MRLKDYLTANEITESEFARMIGTKSVSMVSKWANKGAIPSPDYMIIIYQVTHGRVSPNDFYDLPDLTVQRRLRPAATG